MNGRDSHGNPRPSMVSVFYGDEEKPRYVRRYIVAMDIAVKLPGEIMLVDDIGGGWFYPWDARAHIEVKPESETTNDDPHW